MMMLKTLPEVIDALGGRKAVARLLDVRDSAIGNWIQEERLPAYSFPAIQKELLERGLTGDLAIWKFERKRDARREASL